MNGPEHYRAAEKRLEASDWQRQQVVDPSVPLNDAMHEAAMAQVHATLALAAATAMAACDSSGMHSADFDAWDEAAGAQNGDPKP